MKTHTAGEGATMASDGSASVLLIATIEGIENCGRMLAERVGAAVEVAKSRRDGLTALRRSSFSLVVVEEGMAESDPAWADQIWDEAVYAVPLVLNFSISSGDRLTREIKAALTRRDGEHALARRAVAAEIENALKSSLTGLLLQSELAWREPSVPPSLEPKLRHVVELAGAIREQLKCMTGSGVKAEAKPQVAVG